MLAYVISDINVINLARYENYREVVAPAIDRFGGRYLAQAASVEVLEGTWNPTRIVVVEFPSRDDALRFFSSPEVQHARSLRQNVAMVNMILVDGNVAH